MPDDWSWFFSSEYGRDRMLRDEVEGLQRSAYESSAQSARLSSQLRTLQGSIEARLQALSTAFDAYVELGDVREQLAGHPDTGAVRRDVLAALRTLEWGGVPEPVDGRDVDYWLVGAAAEVIGLATGHGPSGATSGGATAAGGRQEHEMFVVAASGWLGHGDRVSARVAPLLVADGALAEPQVLLWRAAVHGTFGDVLEPVQELWRAELEQAGPSWLAFVQEAAGTTDPVATLRWVLALLDGTWTPEPGPAAEDRGALRSLVDALVGAGLGDEQALLARARVLRARIEDPGAPEPDPRAEPPRTSTTDLVRQALLDPAVPPAMRQQLVGWVRPGLTAAAQEVADRVAAEQPGPTVARTEMGDVRVGTDGADPTRLAHVESLLTERWANPRSRTVAPAAAAGVTLVIGLVLLATRLSGLGVFLLAVAAALLGVLVRELLRARSRRAELVDAQQRLRDRVDQARSVAVAARTASLETKAEVAGLARAVSEHGAGSPSLR